MKRFIYSAACVYVVILLGRFVISFISAWKQTHGGQAIYSWPPWLAVVGLLTMIISWIGSIYYWSLSRQLAGAWLVTLVALVLLGVFCGPFYVVFKARKLKVWDRSAGAVAGKA